MEAYWTWIHNLLQYIDEGITTLTVKLIHHLFPQVLKLVASSFWDFFFYSVIWGCVDMFSITQY